MGMDVVVKAKVMKLCHVWLSSNLPFFDVSEYCLIVVITFALKGKNNS